MFDIEQEYNDNVQNLHKLAGLALENVEKLSQSLEIGLIVHDLEKAIDRAKLYDIAQFKRSQGGKKSADNMTAEERKARALKASHARKAKKNTAGDAGKASKGTAKVTSL